MFGLHDSIFKESQGKINRQVSNGEDLRDIIRKICGAIKGSDVLDENKEIDSKAYQKHLV